MTDRIDPDRLPERAVEAAAEHCTRFGTLVGVVTIEAVPRRRLPDAVAAFLNDLDDDAMMRGLRLLQERVAYKGPKALGRPKEFRSALLAAVQEATDD